jgi:enediyne biosynthesis protein E4
MSAFVKQILAVIVLVALIGSVFLLRHHPTEDPSGDALKRYGFFLQDVSKEAGIDFIHQAPTLDDKLNDIMPIIASMGAGVSIVDFDRDGLLDIYVINSGEGSKNRLYRNMGDGTFKDVAEEMGVADWNKEGTGVCMGAVWGDFDNDGYEDLLIYKWGRPELFHNDKGKGFTCVTEKANLPKWLNANSAIWLDYDRDGHLDLFLAGYWPDELNLWKLDNTIMMPESFEYAKNGGRKYLLRNKGDGTFEDVTRDMGITSTRWTLAAAACDLCGSGYPDLFLANDYGVSELYVNKGGKGFVEIGERSGVGKTPKSGMNVSFGDIYNSGKLGVYVSNISARGNLVQGNNFWLRDEDATGEKTHFTNQANALNVELGGWSWGAQFGDLNNDGKLDLYLANGYISGDRNKDNYWFDYSKIAGANKLVIEDAKNWPAMRGRSLSGYEQKCVWLNKGGNFVDVAPAIGVTDTYDGRAVAMADLWNRGMLDVVVANQKGPLLVYKNTVNKDNQWVQFDLEGTKSNRSAIGARVRLFWNGRQQVQDVSGGSGYAAQNQHRLHFGLGADPKIEKVIIEWPSGQKQTIDSPEAGICHSIKEPQ